MAQLLTLQILGSPFLFLKESAETPILIVFFEKQLFYKKTNVAQLLTLKWPKRGPVINSTAYIYIYIYIYAVKLKSGPRFGGFKVKKWSKFKVKKWSKFFFHCFSPIFIVFWGHFEKHK